MKVIQIIDSLNTGGAEVLAVNIANSLAENGIDSFLCASRKEGNLKHTINKKVKYLFLERNKTFDISAILKLKNFIKKNEIQIIHAHSSSYFIAFCVKILYSKVRVIWHDHYGVSQNLSQRNLFPIKWISSYFDVIISVNKKLKNWALTNLMCKKVVFLANFALFNTIEKSTKLKGIANKKIVHLAAFRAQKDHETLINAFYLFSKNNKNWSLHLIGAVNNGLYSKKITDLIKSKNLEKSVFIYGACLDISNILNQSDLGVLPSLSEGLPISILEYGLAKLPVIVTHVGECSKVVKDGISGFVIEPKNIEELSSKMDILARSEALRKSFGLKHYNHVMKNYSKEKFTNNLLDIYK